MKATLTTVALLVLLAAPALPASAQSRRGQVDLTPFAGVFVPTNNIVDADAITTGTPAVKHSTALVVGGRLTYWLRSNLGLEASVAFSPNEIESTALGIPGDVDADFLVGSLRLVCAIGKPGHAAFLMTGGVGFFGTTYDDPLDMTTGGLGILGFGARIPLGGPIALRLQVEDQISTTEWETVNGKTDLKLQNDLTFKGGLTLSFGGR
jgi:hypothetical protein